MTENQEFRIGIYGAVLKCAGLVDAAKTTMYRANHDIGWIATDNAGSVFNPDITAQMIELRTASRKANEAVQEVARLTARLQTSVAMATARTND